MAWTTGCSGNTNEELVNKLYDNQMFTKSSILDAMLKTDRSIYCPVTDTTKMISSKYQYGPYADAPQSIGYKVTISAPYIHAQNLELLHDQILTKDSKTLDVGCGSGILLGYMARMASKSSNVFKIIFFLIYIF
jgi:protein-L-isoaspartate(D-aspartate) O-methyltransferase